MRNTSLLTDWKMTGNFMWVEQGPQYRAGSTINLRGGGECKKVKTLWKRVNIVHSPIQGLRLCRISKTNKLATLIFLRDNFLCPTYYSRNPELQTELRISLT